MFFSDIYFIFFSKLSKIIMAEKRPRIYVKVTKDKYIFVLLCRLGTSGNERDAKATSPCCANNIPRHNRGQEQW